MTMAAATARLRRLRGTDLRAAAIVLPFLLLFVALAVASPPFLTTTNLLNLLDQQSHILIIAAAGTLVLVAGGIDLSVGAVAALSAVVAATVTLAAGPVVGIAAGLGVGLVAGLANGFIVTFFRINSLIATLAMSFVLAGLASLVTGGNLLVLFDHPGFGAVSRTDILGVRSSTWLMLLAVLIIGVILARTTAGRYMYAVGGNSEAASLAGVPVRRVRLATFVLSGGAAGLGGVIIASRTLSAQATSGQELAFTVLAGIVVGGTSIAGGEGAVWRTVVGILFIALIGNGFNLLGLDPLYRQIALGVIILLAVGLDAALRSGRR
ncbi:MAG TPA: ABC transporter permease [Candidatus Limnocylindria bacterium]|nr:ABC transporter permease [Candidatus Limnocylindria bacterium]